MLCSCCVGDISKPQDETVELVKKTEEQEIQQSIAQSANAEPEKEPSKLDQQETDAKEQVAGNEETKQAPPSLEELPIWEWKCPWESRALSDQDRKRIENFLECNKAPGWKPISNMFGPKTTKKSMLQQEGNPLVLIKGVSPLKCKAIDTFKLFADPSKWHQAMKIADVMFVGGEVLEVLDAHHMVLHAKFRTPPGVINRDFCFTGLCAMLDEHTAVTLVESVVRADCPASDSTWSWVRGEIKVSGYMAKDDPNGDGCELTYIVQVDPKGWLPTWVVNIVAADQADNVTRIAQHFKKNPV
mmetsp:Transcript_74228/g.135550  ORF Transcript_74228/g.135550 Transcript_74228/m.135550 type:complete len:300 (-) Transcript_74228:58-957(-)